MKSVLISIQPKWCELIANGKKTVEVRKTNPKCETPFKAYIYCTSSNVHECLMQNESGVKLIYAINYKTAIPCGGHIANGKVIGEFVCDSIDEFSVPYPAYFHEVDYITRKLIENACLKPIDIHGYNGTHQTYAWHISDLVIYDKPKELSEFKRFVDRSKGQRYHEDMLYLQRPPQSWCYVEERSNP